jgi:hypothetical protein
MILASSSIPTGWSGTTGALTNCGILQNIMGGLNSFKNLAYLERLFNQLPPHFRLNFAFRFIKIDSWDAEKMQLYLNGNVIFGKTINWNDNLLYGSQCGLSNYPETADLIYLQLSDSSDSALVRITTTLDGYQSDEWWGLGSFFFGVERCHTTCKTCSDSSATSCINCQTWSTVQPDGSCKCTLGYYQNPDGCTSNVCEACKPCGGDCDVCLNSLTCTRCRSSNENILFIY